ncbi:redoxin domain-containing protein, partial [Escherichia coli]|nr:redoxin domain-containing protein [Escherichia coli]
MNPLKAGDIAPKFSLPDQDGEQVNLTDFQGQRVLFNFYSNAIPPGVNLPTMGLRDKITTYQKGVVYFLCTTTKNPKNPPPRPGKKPGAREGPPGGGRNH